MPRRTDNRSTISAFASIELVDRLYRYSQRHGITKSEAARRLIAFGLDCAKHHPLPPSALGAGAPTEHRAASTTTPSSGGSGSEEPRPDAPARCFVCDALSRFGVWTCDCLD